MGCTESYQQPTRRQRKDREIDRHLLQLEQDLALDRLAEFYDSLYRHSELLQRILCLLPSSCGPLSQQIASQETLRISIHQSPRSSPSAFLANTEELLQLISSQAQLIHQSLKQSAGGNDCRLRSAESPAEGNREEQKPVKREVGEDGKTPTAPRSNDRGTDPSPCAQERKQWLSTAQGQVSSLLELFSHQSPEAFKESSDPSVLSEPISTLHCRATVEIQDTDTLLSSLLLALIPLLQRLPDASTTLLPTAKELASRSDRKTVKSMREKATWMLKCIPEVAAWVEGKLSVLELYHSRIERMTRAMSERTVSSK